MQQKHIRIAGTLPMTRERVIRLVSATNRYASLVLLESEGCTINGKSMLGLLSVSRARGRDYVLKVAGEDEVEAIAAIGALLEEPQEP